MRWWFLLLGLGTLVLAWMIGTGPFRGLEWLNLIVVGGPIAPAGAKLVFRGAPVRLDLAQAATLVVLCFALVLPAELRRWRTGTASRVWWVAPSLTAVAIALVAGAVVATSARTTTLALIIEHFVATAWVQQTALAGGVVLGIRSVVVWRDPRSHQIAGLAGMLLTLSALAAVQSNRFEAWLLGTAYNVGYGFEPNDWDLVGASVELWELQRSLLLGAVAVLVLVRVASWMRGRPGEANWATVAALALGIVTAGWVAQWTTGWEEPVQLVSARPRLAFPAEAGRMHSLPPFPHVAGGWAVIDARFPRVRWVPAAPGSVEGAWTLDIDFAD